MTMPARLARVQLAVGTGVARTPLYFGPSDRRLFGWLHRPAGAGARAGMGVAICPAVGHEYINAHRSLRHLADRLAAAGLTALRFDYYGTGDSAGQDDAPRLAGWVTDARAALAVLRARAGCTGAALAGFRLGASVATLAACEEDVDALLLWAPCLSGRGYIRELRALSLTTDAPPAGGVEFDACGFRLTRRLQDDLAALHLERVVPRARAILLGSREELADGAALAARWRSAGLPVDRQLLSGYPEMVLAPHNTVVPDAAIDAVVAWAASRADSTAAARGGAPDRRRATEALVLDRVRESARAFGRHGEGVAIVSEPAAAGTGVERPTVVIANAGSTHHVGPNRLHVALARALSSAGFRCVRFDLPGLGDSVSGDETRENVPYPADATSTVREVMDATGSPRGAGFVVMGLCSGAHTAFHAALDLRDRLVEIVLINPLTFDYRPGLSLDAPAYPTRARWRRVVRSMGSLEGWVKLIRSVTRAIVPRRRPSSVQPGLSAASSDLPRQLETIAAAGIRLTFFFSRFDPGYDLLMTQASRTVRALKRAGRLRVSFVNNANHTFDRRESRLELVASIARGLAKRYP